MACWSWLVYSLLLNACQRWRVRICAALRQWKYECCSFSVSQPFSSSSPGVLPDLKGKVCPLRWKKTDCSLFPTMEGHPRFDNKMMACILECSFNFTARVTLNKSFFSFWGCRTEIKKAVQLVSMSLEKCVSGKRICDLYIKIGI